MSRQTRRQVIQLSTTLAIGTLSGCSLMNNQGEPPDSTPSTSQSTTDRGRSSSVYISEVLANPEGPDDANLNKEYVLIETSADAATNFSGYTLTYSPQLGYEFPELVSDVEPRATITVYSGTGDASVNTSPPQEYTLFVGSDVPLLSNEGMQLIINTPDGEVVDSVNYPALDSGVPYIRPE